LILTKSYAWRVASVLACGLCVAVLTSAPIPAQRGEGADGALSGDRLARVGQMIDRRVAEGDVPGAVTLVAQNGRIVHFEARGVIDIDAKKPLPKDAIFSLASLTKPVTTVAVLMLIEEGKVRLGDPVSKFIPAFSEMNVAVTPARTVAASRPVTIRDLLTHTSGIVSPARIPTDGNATLAEYILRFAKEPLEFQPGTHWTYSNTVAFDMLARVVEVASGQTYDRFLHDRIFEPLGMNDTAHALTDAQKQRLATRYDVVSNGLRKNVRTDTPMYFGGGWGLNSTALDYYRFAQMLLNKGELDGRRLLSPRAVELMQSVHISDTLPGRTPGVGWGLGVRVIIDAGRAGSWLADGSFGWTGASGTHFWVDPADNLVAVMMAAAPAADLKPDFETAVMQALHH
jgi:CubicO group peptidase (beta-lactamase class C family)